MRRILARLCMVVLAGALVSATVSASSSAARRTRNSAGAFPVAVRSGDGVVRIPARPDRILCLSGSATQMLYALGAGSQVVGVDKYSTYPPNAPRTSFTGYETSAEDYLPLRPDLVILAFNVNRLIAQLKTLHIPTLLLPPVSSIAGVDHQLNELAIATGHRTSGARVEASLAASFAAAAHRVGGAVRNQTYYVEVGSTLYSATSKTFIGAVFAIFSMRNIADAAGSSSGYPQLSAEYLLRANPDYVVLADGQSASAFAHRPGFFALRAVRLHHVIVVPESFAQQWGPHSLEAFANRLAIAFAPRVRGSGTKAQGARARQADAVRAA